VNGHLGVAAALRDEACDSRRIDGITFAFGGPLGLRRVRQGEREDEQRYELGRSARGRSFEAVMPLDG